MPWDRDSWHHTTRQAPIQPARWHPAATTFPLPPLLVGDKRCEIGEGLKERDGERFAGVVLAGGEDLEQLCEGLVVMEALGCESEEKSSHLLEEEGENLQDTVARCHTVSVPCGDYDLTGG